MLQVNKIPQIKLHLLLFVLFQISFIYFLYAKPLPVLILVGAGIFCATILPDIKKFFLCILIILLVIPSLGYNLPPINFSITLKVLYSILLVFVIFFIAYVAIYKRKLNKASLHPVMLFFLFWVVICAFIGLSAGNKTELIRLDLLLLSLYGLYFLIPTIINSRSSFSALLTTIIICSGIIALEYLVIFFTNLANGVYVRINPNQGLIFIFSVPLIVGTIIKIHLSKIKRVLLIGLVILCLGGIAITFTRGLWVSVTISTLIMLFLFRREINKKILLGTFIIVIFGSIFVLIYLAHRVGLDILSLVGGRASTFFRISQDISVQQRLLANESVFQQILESPLLGCGLGKQTNFSYLGSMLSSSWIDNSYLVLLWKLGIVGTIAFLLIYIKSLSESIKLFKATKNRKIKIFTGALISFIIAWLILGAISPQMIKYLLNFVWITLIALIDSIKNFSYENINPNP